jgi:adenine-specific DNA-methyltransferase
MNRQSINKTVQPNTDFLNQLRSLLPQFFTQEKVDDNGEIAQPSCFDFQKFHDALKSHDIKELQNGYRLDFTGKDYARRQAGEQSETIIVPDNEHNRSPENKNSKNLFFTGDNIEVLRHLQNNYANSIDIIYIDPPYNTGNDGFIYPDKFEYRDEQLRDMFGLNEDELERLKSIQGRSTHSAWLTFMYPRLYLARKLLKNNGIIFVSIDDNEQHNLRFLCDELFGEDNFVNNIIWYYGKMSNEKNKLPNNHEYVLVYRKNSTGGIFSKVKKEDSEYRNRYSRYLTPQNTVCYGSVKDSSDKLVLLRVAKIEKELNKQKLSDNDVLFDFNKEYKSYSDTIYVPTIKGNSEERVSVFDTGQKPLELMKLLLRFGSSNKYAKVLDFFAGSATTADAVMSLNAEDGGSRQYIMVQLHEPTREGTAAHEKGYRFIDDISRARIEKAAAKIKKENPLLADTQDLGFKHYRVVKPEQPTLDAINNYDPNQIELFNDMISPFSGESLHVPGNATGIDTILTTYLVQDGYKFDEQVTDLNLAGYDSSYVGKTRVYLIAEHWGSEQTKALVNLIGTNAITVQTVIVYGYSFAMESMRELEIALSQLETKVNLVVRY